MILSIFQKEWRLALRAGRIWPLLAAWAVLSFLAALGPATSQSRAADTRAAAEVADRKSWDAQGERNPHSAAHFGQYAHKPATALGALEPGLDAWLGTSIWMEAHYQNPASQRAAEDLTPLSRMASLSLGWLLQVLLPLTILVLGFDLLAEDRARGALKLQMVAGAGSLPLMLGKGLSLLATTLLVISPALLATLAVWAMLDPAAFPDAGQRLGLWLSAYGLYAGVWLLLTLCISAFASSARLSLGLLSGLWLLGALLLPRLAAEQAEAAHPTPEPAAFWEKIRTAQREGIEGEATAAERNAKLEAETLQRYGVATVEELPVGFGGLRLQAGEEYADRIFDRYYTELWQGYQSQVAQLSRWAWLAPVLATRALATQSAGTDVSHHQRFADAAEVHRRALQRYLNGDIAKNAVGISDYRAGGEFWSKAPRFEYVLPEAQPAPGSLVTLGAWLLAGLLGCALAMRALRQEPSA